jgi:hypothetical protein
MSDLFARASSERRITDIARCRWPNPSLKGRDSVGYYEGDVGLSYASGVFGVEEIEARQLRFRSSLVRFWCGALGHLAAHLF